MRVRERVAVAELRSKLQETSLWWLGHIVRRKRNYVGKRAKRMTAGKQKHGRRMKGGRIALRETWR